MDALFKAACDFEYRRHYVADTEVLDVTSHGVGNLTSWLRFLQSPVITEGLDLTWRTEAADCARCMMGIKDAYPRLTKLCFGARDALERHDTAAWLSTMTRLRHLIVRMGGPAENATIGHVDLSLLRDLRWLTISRNAAWRDNTPVRMDAATVALPPTLEILRLSSVEVMRATGLLARMPALKMLFIEGGTLFLEDFDVINQDGELEEEEGVCAFVGACPSLRELYVENMTTYNQAVIECLLADADGNCNVPNLRTLDAGALNPVPPCVGQLSALRELRLSFDDYSAPFGPGAMDPLTSLAALRELTYYTERYYPGNAHDATSLPFLPGVTRLECSNMRPMVDVAYSLPNLKHLRVSHCEPATISLEPLSRLTALTSLMFDGFDEIGPVLPPNLHLVRSLRHLCMHGDFKGGPTVRRALGACSIETVCCKMIFQPPLHRPTFSVIDCPIPITRVHESFADID